ncbi:MAG: family permease [Cryobacterium sp.]|nr:family permease [Cryobacterium sp.]
MTRLTKGTTMTDSSTTAKERHRLSGQLGTGSIVFMVMAAAAPLTVIGGNVPLIVGAGNGVGAPIGFAAAALVLLIFSVGFVTMTPHVREAGAFFSYVASGLGSRFGLGAAFVALVAYTAIQVGIYGYMGWAANDLVTHFGGPELPWWLYSFATLVIVALLGYRHIELGARVLGVALVLEIAVMLVLDVVIFATGGESGPVLETFAPENILTPGMSVAILFSLTGFIGFEATAVFRDEARNPERTIPRATYAAVIIIGVFYAVSCWALVTGAGSANAVDVAQKTLAGEGNMMLDAASQYVGSAFSDVMSVLLISSLFACVLSFHNVIARYQFSLANKGVLPGRLGVRNVRHNAPTFSSLVQSITAAIVLAVLVLFNLDPLVGVFGSMAGVSTVGMVILMLLTSIAVVVFFKNRPTLSNRRPIRTIVAPTVAILGLGGCLWLVLANFTLVTGWSVGVSIFLALVPVIALGAGVAVGGRFSLHQADEADVVGSPVAPAKV